MLSLRSKCTRPVNVPQIVTLSTAALVLLGAVSHAAPVKKLGVKGTQQMAGGQAQFGTTYTVVSSDGSGPWNFTILSAKYAPGQFSVSSTDSYACKANEKLLIIHYRIKNPMSTDQYYSDRHLFQAVDENNATIDDYGSSRRESVPGSFSDQIKPGQGVADLETYIVVPSTGPIPKLIFQMARTGTSDKVTRFALGKAPNTVAPLTSPYADPSDPTGDTKLANIKAVVGTTYTAGYFDVTVNSIEFAPGPLGTTTASDGNHFLVASITATNKSLKQLYESDLLNSIVTTSDDDKITDHVLLKPKSDVSWDGRQVAAGESINFRLVIQVATSATITKFGLAEAEDNTGDQSEELDYDLSNLK